jgi:hypothetical protein
MLVGKIGDDFKTELVFEDSFSVAIGIRRSVPNPATTAQQEGGKAELAECAFISLLIGLELLDDLWGEIDEDSHVPIRRLGPHRLLRSPSMRRIESNELDFLCPKWLEW